MTQKKSGAGGKLGRSEIIQARLDSKLRYAAEIIATYERRTLSSLVEAAIERLVETYTMNIVTNGCEREVKLKELMDEIWSPNEVIRFLMTAFVSPDLFDSAKQELWKFIYNKPYFWEYYEVTYKSRAGETIKKMWQPYRAPSGVAVENLNKFWDLIQDEESRSSVYIPDEMGEQISPPTEVKTEFIIDYDESMFVENNQAEIELLQLLRENIHHLIKYKKNTIQTPEGPKVVVVPIYPSEKEQEEMIERLYQEKFHANKV